MRWYRSLIFRVTLLCAVLLVCLLTSVYAISRHYFREAVQEMQLHGLHVAEHVSGQLARGKSLEEIDVPQKAGEETTVSPLEGEVEPEVMSYTSSEKGVVTRVGNYVFKVGDKKLVVTSRMVINPQTEVLSVFKNKYLAAVTFVFLVALGLMIYSIFRVLRPIGELSDTCAAISQGNLRNVEVRRSSGEIRALEQTFNRMVASLREKEIVEANLRQAQRLSALGTLAAGVAHDVRNPLNAIKLLSSHAMDTLPNVEGLERTSAQLRTIREEVDRIEEIVSRFLSLAKERDIQPEPVRVDTLLEECVSLLRRDAEGRDVRLVAELRAGDTELMLDPKQWRRAVLNILINALEACRPGGRVRLFSRVTDLTCEIEVRDDGPGMPKDIAERAFEPYFTTKSTGTGLGLSITRGIVEEHGGRIQLSSSEGQGCQVLITLPLEGTKA